MIYLAVFLSAACLDLAYVRWMLYVRDDHRARAAIASMCIGACGMLGLTSVVVDHWAAIPYLLGLGVGTWFGMRK